MVASVDALSKVDIVKMWHHDYHHDILKEKKESSCEQSHNNDFFVCILAIESQPVPLPLSKVQQQKKDSFLAQQGNNQ